MSQHPVDPELPGEDHIELAPYEYGHRVVAPSPERAMFDALLLVLLTVVTAAAVAAHALQFWGAR